MLNLNQNNTYPVAPFLRSGFRVFFMAAGLIAVVSMILWAMFFHTSILNSSVTPYIWHAHEMIFAYTMAVIAGFLLTAIKNWTGVQTLYGKPLLALFVLWAMARFMPFVPKEYLIFQAIIDISFLLLACIAAIYPIIKTKQWQHSGIIVKLLLMTMAHGLFYLGLLNIVDQGVTWGLYLGFYLVLSLIFMMIRRLLPFFIERGLALDYMLKNSKFLDISSLILLLIFIPIEVFFDSPIGGTILALSLFLIHSIRLIRWHHFNIWKKPLLWGLYMAYVFLTLGFGFKVLAYFIMLPPNLSTHSFAFGISLLTLSMMSRISLGHTGNDVLNPPKKLTLIFALLSLSFVVRVILPIWDMVYYSEWILIAQLLWISAFIWFLWIYIPIFFKPRIDGQFG